MFWHLTHTFNYHFKWLLLKLIQFSKLLVPNLDTNVLLEFWHFYKPLQVLIRLLESMRSSNEDSRNL